jgi:signal transduction histidine kinase
MLEERDQILTESVERTLRVRGDRDLLLQLIANLLENAIRHSPRGAAIEIRVVRRDDRVEISVSDNGPGIPADMRAKVLQRFFRLEQSRTTPGNGLGLSLAQAIAKLHDASLRFSDALPGLCVTVSLQRAG